VAYELSQLSVARCLKAMMIANLIYGLNQDAKENFIALIWLKKKSTDNKQLTTDNFEEGDIDCQTY
jgi:hypothetical protein